MNQLPTNNHTEKMDNVEIKKYTRDDLLYLRNYHLSLFWKLERDVEEIGLLSSAEQHLSDILTSLTNIVDNNHTLYCLIHQDELIGILKIGVKKLYLYNQNELHCEQCACLLDFYILKKFQNRGLGIELFNFMLRDNSITPSSLCYDNPSYKLQNFLKKYFSPCNLIKQPNNFVIFSGYFRRQEKTTKIEK
ncbi:alpha-tubulin N-acetyltransferase [Plasmodium gonderi]|uniref:Alpha-tubulin N-acetyltransferase n=1 Tax=Plasmodium gonderi TaxID=77519 RepID=A0A1Y1JHS4_PLAGO|nr:alpha-tubulin N-acetyltransferase [Plasmodium gonderi]GAW80312.1 alpha-tubulin N-acetyltransferase [Plasmodium gonderi]